MASHEHSQTPLPKVLVVDDEQRVLSSIRMMFRHRFDLFLADDESAALDIVRKHAIDVIVADQQMPGISGVELLAQVRALSPHTVGILMSEYTDLSAIEDSINKIGAFRVLAKPLALGQLRVAIELAMHAARAAEGESEPSPAPVASDALESLADELLSQETPEPTVEARSSRVQDGAGTMTENELTATDVIEPHELAMTTPVQRHLPQTRKPGAGASGVLVFTADSTLIDCVEQVAAGRFPVFVTSNIVQVVRILGSDQPRVLVTDVGHDRETLESMIANLKQYLPELVTIVLAEQYDPTDMAWLINHGQVFRVLRKPISPGRCAVALQAALKHLQTPRVGIVPDDRHEGDAREDSGVMSGVFERLKAVKRLLA